MLQISLTNDHLLAAKQQPYQTAYLLTKNTEGFSGKKKKARRMGQLAERKKPRQKRPQLSQLELACCDQDNSAITNIRAGMCWPNQLSHHQCLQRACFGQCKNWHALIKPIQSSPTFTAGMLWSMLELACFDQANSSRHQC